MTTRPERRMLLDTASLYFRAFFGVPDTVRAPTGEPVNAVRGLLDMVARLATEFQPTEIVACWDDVDRVGAGLLDETRSRRPQRPVRLAAVTVLRDAGDPAAPAAPS